MKIPNSALLLLVVPLWFFVEMRSAFALDRISFLPFLTLWVVRWACYATYLHLAGVPLFTPSPTTAPTPEKARTMRLYLVGGVVLAMLLRGVWLFATPNLSDDIYRFLWDGNLQQLGFAPFAETPHDFLQNHAAALSATQKGFFTDLYPHLNSPNYYTVYPPVCQAVFAVAARLVPFNIGGATLAIKCFLWVCEGGSLYFMYRLLTAFVPPAKVATTVPRAAAMLLLYALNPLALQEVVGNVHFEGAMLCFGLWALWQFGNGRWVTGGVLMALSIAAKLSTAVWLPFVFIYAYRRAALAMPLRPALRMWVVAGSTFGTLAIAFGWMFGVFTHTSEASGQVWHLFGSLGLYFGRFEYNGSLYYLLRTLGYVLTGYNLIAVFGPLLAIAALASWAGLAWLTTRAKTLPLLVLPQCFSGIHLIFLATATTVHPWYVLMPLAMGVFVPHRVAVVWSFLVGLTYINYAYQPFHENLWVVAFEYLALMAYTFWSMRQWRKNRAIYDAA